MGPALIARVTRAKTLPLIVGPVLVGTALASAGGGAVDWGRLALCVVGAAALHAGSMVLNDVFDARTGADRMARVDRAGILTGSAVIDDGTVSVATMLRLAAAAYGVALACGVALAVGGRPGVLALGAAGAALGACYVAPPVAYGYRGRGLGEVGVVLAYGVLPVLGAAYAQDGRLDGTWAWAGLVPGLATAVALSVGNLLHHRADKAVNKMTPAVVLGPEGALVALAIGLIAVYATLVVQVAVGLFPAWALGGLVVSIPVAASWARAFRDPSPQACLGLLGATLGGSVVVNVSIAGAAAFG